MSIHRIGVLAWALALSAATQTAWAQDNPSPPRESAEDANDDNNIVVTGQRLPGSVNVDVPPVLTLNAQEIRATGAANAAEIVAALSPQLGSARGRGEGGPVVLLNGRRTTGFQEVAGIPADAIARVEVFTEEVALQYGFAADQRVINFILRRYYTARSIEADLGRAGGKASGTGDVELGYVSITRANRTSIDLRHDRATRITELERDIAAPTSGADQRALRSLFPDTVTNDAVISIARGLSERLSFTTGLRFGETQSHSTLGLNGATGQLITRESERVSARWTGSLDGQNSGWQWTINGALDHSESENETLNGLLGQFTQSETFAAELGANANGALFSLPAGSVRASGRIGFSTREIDSTSNALSTELDRAETQGRLTLTAPITSRRRDFGARFGDSGLNFTASFNEIDAFGALSSIGGGVNWSPIAGVRFSIQADAGENAPNLEQLGNPLLATPSVTLFDFATNTSVSATRISGGNPNLRAEERNDVTFNANWSVDAIKGLDLSFSYSNNDTTDAIASFPLNTQAVEAAFPTRFVRNGAGQLISLDTRPINLASRETETLRYGFNLARSYGKPVQATPGQGQPPWGAGMPPWGSGPPPWARGGQGGGGQRQGGGGPGAMAAIGGGAPGQAPQPGRWNIGLYHNMRIADEVTLRDGFPSLDLLDGGALDETGAPRHRLELDGGLYYRGRGVRLNGTWNGPVEIKTNATGGALEYADYFTLNLRAFMAVDAIQPWVKTYPWLKGVRIAARVDNLLDAAPHVTDANGATPSALQRGFLNPRGRVWEVSVQKRF